MSVSRSRQKLSQSRNLENIASKFSPIFLPQKTAARLQKENLKMTFAISPPLIDTGNHSDSQSEGELPVEVHVDVESSEEWKMLKKDTIIAQQGLKYSLLDILRYFKKNPKAVELILGMSRD